MVPLRVEAAEFDTLSESGPTPCIVSSVFSHWKIQVLRLGGGRRIVGQVS